MSDTKEFSTPGALMIAAPSSGSGKTVLTLALLRALRDAGYRVCSAKAGPDYIDPVFHAHASGGTCINLDPWAMSSPRLKELALRQFQTGEFLIIESMMGLFDGAADGSGSGAELAKALDIPVIFIVDAAKQSHSIAALVKGFQDYDPGLKFGGVILNKVGSDRHELMLREALSDTPILGAVRRNDQLQLPERHLGLVQAGELDGLEEFVGNAANLIGSSCDLQQIAALATEITGRGKMDSAGLIPPPGQRVAIARDVAFSFAYPHLLDDWRKQGVELSFFSPLANERPCEQADAIYLPGGYPELYAAGISHADGFMDGMKRARTRNCLIYGECGGYMVLGDGLIDAEGNRHEMLGFLGLETSFKQRKLHLGYRKAVAGQDFFAGQNLMAHEFHYTSALRQQGEPLFECTDALGNSLLPQGLVDGNVMGSYLHLIDKGIIRHG